MTKTAGIKPLSRLNASYLGEIKQSILLFDLLGIPSFELAINSFNQQHNANCKYRYVVNELEFLKEEGHLFDCLPLVKASTILRNDIDAMAFSKEFEQLSKIIQSEGNLELSMEAAARLSCLVMNNELQSKDYYSIPLIKQLRLSENKQVAKSDVINLVIDQMPIPDDKTPWDNIFEFKSNVDNKGRFAGLRSWVNQAVNSEKTIVEIKDELEYLLYQYQKSLELHKVKHHTGTLQTIVVGGAELVENLMKFKFSKIAKGLFSAHQSKAELLTLELTAPGHELAYIYKSREKFS